MECSICYEVISKADAHHLRCKHFFHTGCITRWTIRSPNCPLCRESIGLSRSFLLARLTNILREYECAKDFDEKEHKRTVIYRMIERHNLACDASVLNALIQYNVPIPEICLYE